MHAGDLLPPRPHYRFGARTLAAVVDRAGARLCAMVLVDGRLRLSRFCVGQDRRRRLQKSMITKNKNYAPPTPEGGGRLGLLTAISSNEDFGVKVNTTALWPPVQKTVTAMDA